MKHIKNYLEAKRLTPAGEHFFFGYYDRVAISSDVRYHLALHTGFMDRPNTSDDRAEIGVIDLDGGNAWTPLDDDTAWNWQMGANQHWLLTARGHKVIYNVRNGTAVFARIRDIDSGEATDLSVPIYTVSPDGSFALSLNFARLHDCRPGYGYVYGSDPWADVPASEDDGLFHVDLRTGKASLIVSLAQCREVRPVKSMDVGKHWFNHIMISPCATRLMFFHRWRIQTGSHATRLFTCAPDGSDLYLLNRGPMVSHADWRGDTHILSWCQHSSADWHYYLMRDKTQEAEIIGEGLFHGDGHCSYRPSKEKRWILTDAGAHPDKKGFRQRDIILYDTVTDTRVDIGRFAVLPGYIGEIRCDFHPRWDSTGNIITFDSIHEGYRGIYRIDVSDVVGF